ncbi:MAG: hypothetical protein K6F68_00815 [Clostridiales bacterium]|nr:hypothetical protein [Clostridiales bacterium]
MNGGEKLYLAMSSIAGDLAEKAGEYRFDNIEKTSENTKSRRPSRPLGRVLIGLAAAVVLVVSIGAGAFAYAEAKEYKEAAAFFEENCLISDGLTRREVRAVYRDISSGRLELEKTGEVLERSLAVLEQRAEEEREHGSSLKDAELIAKLSVVSGWNEHEDYPNTVHAYDFWPTAFAVEDGKVYIADSNKSAILIIENGDIKVLPVPEPEGRYISLEYMAVKDGVIYMLSYKSATGGELGVTAFGEDGSIVFSVPVPNGVTYLDPSRLYFENGGLMLLTHNLTLYRLDETEKNWERLYHMELSGMYDETKTFKNASGFGISITTGPNTMASFKRLTDSFLYAGVYDFVPDVPVISFEYTLRKFDLSGNLVGMTRIDVGEFFFTDCDFDYISNDGEVYVLHCLSDGVYVTKPNLRTTFSSRMAEIAARTREYYERIKKRGGADETEAPTAFPTEANSPRPGETLAPTPELTPAPTATPAPSPVPPVPTADPVRGIPEVFPGKDVFFLLYEDGTLWAVGQNAYGQLGRGDTEPSSVPVMIGRGLKPVLVGETVLALDNNGALWGWGRNDCGQLGLGDRTNRLVPVRLMNGVKSVFKYVDRYYCLKNDGKLYTWGYEEGRSNISDEEKEKLLKPVLIFKNVESYDPASRFAITKNHELWNAAYTTEPRKLADDVTAVWSWNGIVIADTEGRLWEYDRSTGGRFPIIESFKSVVYADETAYVLTDAGELYLYRTLEFRGPDRLAVQRLIHIMDGVKEFYAGHYSTDDLGYDYKLALKENGELWSWTKNGHGAPIGRAHGFLFETEEEPACVATGVKKVVTNRLQTFIVTESGELYATGFNGEDYYWSIMGTLGDGSTETRFGFVRLDAWFVTNVELSFVDEYRRAYEGYMLRIYNSGIAVLSDGSVLVWGCDLYGLPGDTDSVLLTPVRVSVPND